MPRSTDPSRRPRAPGTKSSSSSSSSKKRKPRNKPSRALNAFAIASAENPDDAGIPAHRLGAAPAPRKRDGEDDDDDGSVDGGEDSSGNEWRVGEVDSDDDSDIDSDDAMGESDEERFADFAFRGSSAAAGGKKKKGGKKQARREVDLAESEEDEADMDSDEEDEDGEGYIDLSEMLDRKTPESGDEEEEEEEEEKATAKKRTAPDSDDDEEEEEDDDESVSDGSDADTFAGFDSDSGEVADPKNINALESLISSLPDEDGRPSKKRVRLTDPNEARAPGEYNVSSGKLTLDDILPTVTDDTIKKSLKVFAGTDKKSGKKAAGVPGKLAAPLAKRQQDRLDRSAAYSQTKETLNRWVDTVKHNREADHLHFPLANAPNAPVPAPSKLAPLSAAGAAPLTALEATISGILKDSNMASEAQLAEYEELKTNQLSVEEVQRRRAELRKARDLMFREEAKAKRIKKIKSKSYHRIKKKERLRDERALEEAITEARGGEVDPEDEMERERQRAEERMSLRHKQSRWAAGAKESGRLGWDDEAREGAVEMARRSDALRRRIAGKAVDGEERDESESEEESDEFDEEGEEERGKTLREIERLEKEEEAEAAGGKRSKLMGMKFMQQAEAARKKENATALQSLREDYEAAERGSDESSDDEDEAAGSKKNGRMVFKPGKDAVKIAVPPKKTEKQEFEAPAGSDDEEAEVDDEEEVTFINNASATGPAQKKNPFSAPSSTKPQSATTTTTTTSTPAENPWLAAAATAAATAHKPKSGLLDSKSDAKAAKIAHKLTKSKSAAGVSTTTAAAAAAAADVEIDLNAALQLAAATAPAGSDDEDEGPINLISARGKAGERQRELVKRAFAGDDVVREFRDEKRRTAADEADKVEDGFLPGWGSWGGAGLDARKRNRGQFRKKVHEGVEAAKRRDKDKDRVIVSERRVKKNATFNATQLPHPFESRAQYERSLRLPIGPEWTTKSTFQAATAPRVMVKQGRVVEPISAPFK